MTSRADDVGWIERSKRRVRKAKRAHRSLRNFRAVGWVEPSGLAFGKPKDRLRETHRSSDLGSESLDVNVIIVPCGVTALEANLAARYTQALRQVGLDEDA